MQIFDSRQTAAGLPFDALITALERVFIEGCNVPRRHIHSIQSQDGEATLLLMPAWQENGLLGIKHVTIYPQNGKRGLPGLHSTYTLFDASNGVPVAVLDGDQITVRRTAAASALAARYLARAGASRLLIVGAGNVAAAIAPAYAAVRDLRRVDVWNINPDRAKQLVSRLRDEGFQAEVAIDLEQAVAQADIVSCATLSTQPLVLRKWLRPGTHLDLIGSFKPDMRESDDATFSDTSVFIDTEEALDKSGDLLAPIAAGLFARDRVLGTLADLCHQRHPGRTSDDEITVYKAVGAASEDLAAAALVYQGQSGQ